jgi:hypothetical protein
MENEKMDLVSDELAVRQLVARFSDVCVVDDTEGFRSLWAPNGVWEISAPFPTKAEGVDNVVALYTQLRSPFEVFIQMAHSGVVQIDGNRARARWVMQEVGRNLQTGRNYNNFGLYSDSLVRLPEGWRFAKRSYQYLWLDIETRIPGSHLSVPDEVRGFI